MDVKEKIAGIRRLYPDISNADIGRCVGVTRERVRQIQNELGIDAKRHKKRGLDLSLYDIWRGMITRCENKNSPSYKYYGGRGIKVCARWRYDYQTFLKDVGPRPSLAHSLDRYPDIDGDYAPDNVRWATAHQQANNKRPRLGGRGTGTPIVVRMHAPQLQWIDAWIVSQDRKISRGEAVRRLIQQEMQRTQ